MLEGTFSLSRRCKEIRRRNFKIGKRSGVVGIKELMAVTASITSPTDKDSSYTRNNNVPYSRKILSGVKFHFGQKL